VSTLDKSALFDAMNAFWDAPTGNDNGVAAAIVAYLDRMGLTGANATAVRRRAALAEISERRDTFMHAAE
jgi:hypothetical protein